MYLYTVLNFQINSFLFLFFFNSLKKKSIHKYCNAPLKPDWVGLDAIKH